MKFNLASMDMISELPDALLLKILSLLPSTKDVVETMVLSKRWQYVWMMVPKLVYDDSYQNIKYGRFSSFVDRSLVLHEAPVIETLHFKLGRGCYGSGDIRVWFRAADRFSVRELIVEIDITETAVKLPRSLYTSRTMLVTLSLSNAVLVDDVTCPISFPSLKQMTLTSMKYPGDEFVERFLSGCPVLEDLVVKQCPNDNVDILSIRVPSLKSLILHKPAEIVNSKVQGFMIDAPSLECLDIVDYSCGFCVIEKNMPKIVKADVDFFQVKTDHLLDCITSVNRLSLCLPNSKDAYPLGSVFRSLVYLKICTCETEWLNLLMRLLRDSPNLRHLELKQHHTLRDEEPRPCWNEPSSFPESLLSNLETFKWINYSGTEEEKQVAAFILRRASCLKKATILTHHSVNGDKKLDMLTELSLSSKFPSCQLYTNED